MSDPPEPPDTPDDRLKCPVCGQEFDNEQGRGGHLAVSKDADHEAFRALGQLPAPRSPGPAEPSPPALPPAPGESPSPAPTPGPGPDLGPDDGEPWPEPRQQGAEVAPEVQEATFGLPHLIEPLLPPQAGPGEASPGTSTKPQAVVVPLEPILAGATAAALNGFFLSGEGDGQLTPALVGATGFPKAAEACLRFYFPDLALDHPLTALIVSGASLGLLVVSLKAKPGQAPAESAKLEAKPAAAPMSAPAPPPVPAAGPKGTTGDPYWDAILARAGGVAL